MRNTFQLLLLLHADVVATRMSGSHSGDDVISDIASKGARQPCSTHCEVGSWLEQDLDVHLINYFINGYCIFW